MPLYEYECDACGRRFEQLIQRFSDPPLDKCSICGSGPVRKLLSSPAIKFKGSGFYITDYAKKDQKADSSSSEDAATGKDKPAKDKAEKDKAEKDKPATDKSDTGAKSRSGTDAGTGKSAPPASSASTKE